MKYYLIAFFLLFSFAASAQDGKSEDKNRERMNRFLNKIGGEKPKETSPLPSRKKEGATLFVDTAKIAVKSFPDVSDYYSECYAKVVNKYGFWKGVGPKLTKNDIRHMWRYVKLLRPKGQPSSAPFTHMQVLDPFGELDNNSYGPILANPFGNDEGISSSWKWKLYGICQFEKICRDGVVIQENMYNKEGKLVLQYYPTSVSKNQIVGHYTDAYGTLARLREDEECAYVGITLDENGYESQIAFMDTKGQLKRNGDDAFMQLLKHDSQGNLIQTMSADAVGNPIIDNCGNCGWQYTFDEKGNDTTATCINQYGQPQRMSKKRADEDCIRVRYTYDKWGNQLTRTFYNENWMPDTITGGIHRYVYTKTLYGNSTSMRAEGLDGRPVSSVAQWHQVLDNQGHRLYYVATDSAGLYSTSKDCLIKARYENGMKTWEEKYTSPNGVDSVLSYRYIRTPNCDSIFHYDDKYIYIERFDGSRRTASEEYYDLEMNPIQRYNFHKHTITYTNRPGINIKEDKYLDEVNRPKTITKDHWRKYNVNVITHDSNNKTYKDFEYDGLQLLTATEVDSVKRQRTITKYLGGRVVDKYALGLSEDCENNISLLYYDSLGFRGRTFKADALYYKARKHVNIQGNSVAWQGFNEFEEPSYILNGDWDNATLYCTNVMGDRYYYDERGDTIPRQSKMLKEFKDSLYKSFCIELIDSVALKLGLQTGDIIVRYGDWHYPVPSQYGRYRESLLCLETVKTAYSKKIMVVMRHDGMSRTSKLIELDLPAGTPKQLGFIYNMLYMTDKEKKRYEEVVKNNRFNVHLDNVNTNMEAKEKIHFFTPYKVGINSNKELFSRGFQENVIVIAWEPHVNGKSYLLTGRHKLFDNLWGHEMDSVTIHYTVDGKNLLSRVLSYKEADQGGRFSNTKVDDASFVYVLADSLQREFDRKYPVDKVVLKPHDAAEQLLRLPGVKISQNDGTGFRGKDDFKYGNVNASSMISVDYDSLGFDNMFLAYNIINNVDFSDYCYMQNDKDYAYLMEKNGRFTECVWNTTKDIVFLSDSVDFYNKMLIIVEVVDSGYFRDQKLDGKFVILKCNDWTIGRKNSELSETIKAGGTRTFVLSKLEGEDGKYSLGKRVKIEAPDGILGISRRREYVSDETFYKAYQFAKRYKRRKRNDR